MSKSDFLAFLQKQKDYCQQMGAIWDEDTKGKYEDHLSCEICNRSNAWGTDCAVQQMFDRLSMDCPEDWNMEDIAKRIDRSEWFDD